MRKDQTIYLRPDSPGYPGQTVACTHRMMYIFEMKKKAHPPKVLSLANIPIYYYSGIFREMEKDPDYQNTVAYLDKHGVEENWDPGFGCKVVFDLPVLDGHNYIFPKNLSRNHSGSTFFARINFGIIPAVIKHDIIFFSANSTMTHWMALFTAVLFRKKIIWRGEASLPKQTKGVKWAIKKRLIRFFLKRADALMYSCTGNKKYIEYFKTGKPLFPISCAVDNDFYRLEYQKLAPERDKIRAELQINPDETVLIFPARLIPRKDPELLVTALAHLRSTDPQLKFKILFVGDGPLRNELEQQCRTASVPAVFTGFATPAVMPRMMCAADIYVILSHEDHSPKALNEAMNFNLPVISSDAVGTVPDLVHPEENGFVIETGNCAQLEEALRQLGNNQKLRAEMGKRSVETVSQFTFNRNAREIKAVINHITNKKGTV